MKVYVGQIYIEADANFPFSYLFQHKIHDELTFLIRPSQHFLDLYAEDYHLIFNMSAKSQLFQNEIKGPTVFKETKDVEYTIFLPYSKYETQDERQYKWALENLFKGICEVLQSLEIDLVKLKLEKDRIIEEILIDPKMFKSVGG